MKKRVLIAYFSGTGGTKRIAHAFESGLRARDFEPAGVAIEWADMTIPDDRLDEYVRTVDMLILLFAVHAFDAPDPVYAWIEKLGMHDNRTAVISVSAGGDLGPNKGSRIKCCKALEKKGFNIVYERMMVMPCNWMIPVSDDVAMWLLKSIPQKVEKILDDLLEGKIVRMNRRRSLFQIVLSGLEKFGANRFPRSFTITPDCNGCGWCAKNCPVQNITIHEKKPVFLGKCVMCMRCIYSCPSDALTSTSFMAIKEGFSLSKVEKRMAGVVLKPIKECTKGALWSGVQRYLEDDDQR